MGVSYATFTCTRHTIGLGGKFYGEKLESEHSSASRWAIKYASINPQGDIVLTRSTLDAMDNPKKIVLLYDTDTETIGLKPARNGEEHAFPLRKRGSRGGHLFRGYKLLKNNNIRLTQLLKFPDIQTELGVLILDLRTAEPVRRP